MSLKPNHSSKTRRSDENDKFNRSFEGLRAKNNGRPKKSGAGGRGTWGDEAAEAIGAATGAIDFTATDPADPSYENPREVALQSDRSTSMFFYQPREAAASAGAAAAGPTADPRTRLQHAKQQQGKAPAAAAEERKVDSAADDAREQAMQIHMGGPAVQIARIPRQ